jgi:hypothetical protein
MESAAFNSVSKKRRNDFAFWWWGRRTHMSTLKSTVFLLPLFSIS